MHLHDRVAIVTGAYRALGQALSRKLADPGVRLVLVGRDGAKPNAFVATLGVSADSVLAVPADVTDAEQVAQHTQYAIRQYAITGANPCPRSPT